MSDNPGLDVLAAIEAMHQELREMRKEAQEGREVREALETLRESGRRRSQEWRDRNVTQRHRNVTVGSLKALDLDPEKQEQVLKTPASRHRDVSNVTQPTRAAYAEAYERRHGAKPVWNATTNAQLARFVKRVGAEEAPLIAEFYVNHRASFYVQKLHPVGLLLSDAEKLRTEWFTGKQMTATKAHQEERTQENVDGWMALEKRPKHGVV